MLFRSLKQIGDEFEEDFGDVMRKGALRGRGKLILMTPKDTGWASRHWSQGLNTSNEAESVTINSLSEVKPGDVVNLFNNVPYIKRLDEGWSTHRPAGFTHLVLQDLNQFFTQQLAQLSKKKAE